jgi:DNA-binding beta-propeller fold protein YncE
MGEFAPGSVFAGHRIEAVAGRGGMGVVYRARQLSLGRTVALKVIAPALMQDAAMRRRFVRESQVAASIDHPHVIPIYYTGEEDGVAFIAMRFVAGDDVRTLVRRKGPLPPERAVRLVRQVAAALDAAHATGLVHRDVKPANVLLGQGDHVYLTDFGLTKHALSEPGAGVTREGHWVGTLDFVSPEQIRGERVDARSDVYALGCLLFYVLAGVPPFARESDEAKLWAHLTEPPPNLPEAARVAAERLDAVIGRALAKTPEQRYRSAGDLGRAAAAAVSGHRLEQSERVVAVGAAAPIEVETRTAGTWLAPPVSATPSARRSGVDRRAAAAAAVLVAALVALAAILATRDSGSNGVTADRTKQQPKPIPSPSRPALTSVLIGGRVNSLAAAGGRIWAGGFNRSKLDAIDPETVRKLAARSVPIGIGLSGIAVTGDTMWAIVQRDRRLLHLDAGSGRRIGRPIALPGTAGAVAADRRTVWVALSPPGIDTADQLFAFDAKTEALKYTLPVLDGVRRLVILDGHLWLLASKPARLERVDLRTGKRSGRRMNGDVSSDLAAGAGALWLTIVDADRLLRVDPRTWNITAYAVGREPAGVAVHHRTVWVANLASSTVSQVDPRTGRIRAEIEVPLNPYELAVDRHGLWITSLAQGRVTRLTTPDLSG